MAKRPRKRLMGVMSALISALFIVSGLFLSLSLLIHDEGFIRNTFEDIQNAPGMGMSTDDLVSATMQMIYYMDGSEPSIDLTVTVDGKATSMFNDRERAHMVDVRQLYIGWRTAAIIFAGIYLTYAAYKLLVLGRLAVEPISRAFVCGSAGFLALALMLGVWAAVDFSAFWTAFHHVFFTNDLWLLNPATDRMIQMMPLEFFYRIVGSFALRFLIPWALIFSIALVILKRDRRKRERGSRMAIIRTVEDHVDSLSRRKPD